MNVHIVSVLIVLTGLVPQNLIPHQIIYCGVLLVLILLPVFDSGTVYRLLTRLSTGEYDDLCYYCDTQITLKNVLISHRGPEA
jgi:hypothetical protein